MTTNGAMQTDVGTCGETDNLIAGALLKPNCITGNRIRLPAGYDLRVDGCTPVSFIAKSALNEGSTAHEHA
jgi:hypothetical protein